MEARAKWSVVLMVTVHMLMLCGHTFPRSMVPEKLWYWSMAYARPLFHQKWELFAPDPPQCSAAIECGTKRDHYLIDRIERNIAFHAAAAIRSEGEIAPPILGAMRKAGCGDELLMQCAIDPRSPTARSITRIQLGKE